jgi:hypothetical protein
MAFHSHGDVFLESQGYVIVLLVKVAFLLQEVEWNEKLVDTC